MTTGTSIDLRHIAWNGIHIDIPSVWDARVLGQRHLIFEKDFQPQLQIRWEKSARRHARAFEKGATRYSAQMGSLVPQDRFPEALHQVRTNFDRILCYQNETGMVTGGICQCAACHALLLFQLLTDDVAVLTETAASLSTVLCHDQAENKGESLWRIQDFALAVPVPFVMQDYTFGAGLTRLSFKSKDLSLQTCKLGPADTRLNQQSLAEILLTLTGGSGLELADGEDDISCTGERNPSILKQIFFRLRREKPFLSTKIRHDTDNNRLLAVILSSTRPIPLTTTEDICRKYEIV